MQFKQICFTPHQKHTDITSEVIGREVEGWLGGLVKKKEA
jgi:hypothetical protein